jgi:hypothetical protein
MHEYVKVGTQGGALKLRLEQCRCTASGPTWASNQKPRRRTAVEAWDSNKRMWVPATNTLKPVAQAVTSAPPRSRSVPHSDQSTTCPAGARVWCLWARWVSHGSMSASDVQRRVPPAAGPASRLQQAAQRSCRGQVAKERHPAPHNTRTPVVDVQCCQHHRHLCRQGRLDVHSHGKETHA